jgi:hypothetical protein
MSKRAAWALLILSAAAVAGLFIFARARADIRRRASGPVVRARELAPLPVIPAPLPPPPAEKIRATLFFVSRADGMLRAEERDVDKPADAVTFARTLMREEIAGPKDAALAGALPDKLALRNAFVPGDGRVVVDVEVDPAWARSAGSNEELAAVAAIVNTLLQNIAGTDRVQILVNGNPVETFAGHVDVSRPLPAMKDEVAMPAATAPAAPASDAPVPPTP